MTTTEINMVAEQYRQDRNSLTEKAKAERERALWAMASSEVRKQEFRRDFLKRLLNESTAALQDRHSILTVGDAGEPLWVRIHSKKMTLGSAATVVKKAKKLANSDQTDMALVIIEALKEYDSLPLTRIVDGFTIRATNPKPKHVPEPTSFQSYEGNDRTFWAGLRTTVAEYLEKKFVGIDSSSRELLKRELETDLKVLVDQFQSKASSVQKREKAIRETATIAITRNKVLEACAALHMDPPSVGGKVDLDKARRQKKLLARAYHPDSNNGDPGTQSKYIEVIQAFEMLETYSTQQSNP